MKSKKENPNGLHKRYVIQKIVPITMEKRNEYAELIGTNNIYDKKIPNEFVVDVDKNAEYFVLRLDEGGSDINHIKACRIGVHAYADAIEATIPKLAKDLRERYPLL